MAFHAIRPAVGPRFADAAPHHRPRRARQPPRASHQSKCLLESLALWYLLRRRGYDATLYLGARTLLGPFEAHAWVELDGKVLNDAPNVRDVYEPFELAAISARPESP